MDKRLALKIAGLCMLFALVAAPLMAQTYDAGAILSAGYRKKICKGFSFSAGAEGKFNQTFTSFERLKVTGSFHYTFWKKHFKVGVFGSYILSNQTNYFESRGRVGGDISFSQDIKNFSLSYRVRAQSTFYDETYCDHKFNPKTYLRNRLQLEYHFAEKPIKLYASTEFFLRLYQRDACFIDAFRTIVGVHYRLNKHNSLDFFLRADNEIQVKKPENVFYIGVAYNFKH